MATAPWYQIENVDQLDSPALIVYPERVKQNIASLVRMVGDVSRLRPHVKTHKSPDATRLLLEAGIYKFKCATIAEAEMLAMCGAKDVLLAYQPAAPKLHRLIELIQQYPTTTFACLVDNGDTAQLISKMALAASVVIPVYIDLNVGMNRTGIQPDDSALALYDQLGQLDGVKPVGLHAYDGHIRDTDLAVRTERVQAAFAPVWRLVQQLTSKGHDKPVVVAGGSPTFTVHAQDPRVECSPGTFIYWDKGYQTMLPEQPFEPAALVLTRVVSRPGDTQLCLDLGHKSIAAENDLAHRVILLDAPELQFVGQSEEHLVVDVDEHNRYQVGDVLYGLPNHICPTCALYERAYTIENGRVTGEWKTLARDRKIGY